MTREYNNGDKKETVYGDLLDFPVIYLSGLPLKTTIRANVSDIKQDILFTTSRIRLAGALATNQIVFNSGEYEAATIAAIDGQALSDDFKIWCLHKVIDYRWFLTLDEAIGTVQTHSKKRSTRTQDKRACDAWTWRRFLQHFELKLLKIEIEY